MFLPKLSPLPGPLTMAGTAMGGMALLAGIGPFLAGVGVGAGVVGGACLARRAMKKRSEWRDEPTIEPMDPAMPDEGMASPS